jgi:uncharacterized LabA/DUF88 family protein
VVVARGWWDVEGHRLASWDNCPKRLDKHNRVCNPRQEPLSRVLFESRVPGLFFMEQSALFVDAGYLLTEGGGLLLGKKPRTEIGVRYSDLAAWLATQAEDTWGTPPLLRTYWYDGAPGRQLTVEQEIVAEQSYVSLRLGTLKNGEQKGVDALIYRDMITLGRERAMARAYLLSGDEDLYEGVRAVQDMGVQVVLIGIPAAGGRRNQAEVLCREADDVIVLSEHDLKPFYFATRFPTLASVQASKETTEAVGEALGEDWAARLNDAQLATLQASPSIPHRLDAHIINCGKKCLKGTVSPAHLRLGFRAAISRAASTRGV